MNLVLTLCALGVAAVALAVVGLFWRDRGLPPDPVAEHRRRGVL